MDSDDPPGCEGHEHPKHEHDLVPEWVIDRSAEMFKAMGDPARLRLLEALMQGRHCVSELASEFDVGMSTVSQRLAALHSGGLIRREREGRHVYYELDDDHVIELLNNVLAHAAETHT